MQARFFASCIISAITYLHKRRVLYRDLKSENIMIDSQGYAMLVDFGFAKRVIKGKTHTYCGTPEYMAPEMVLGVGHEKGADIWSFGCLVYEMLFGFTPFYSFEKGGNSQDKLMDRIVHAKFTFPTSMKDRRAEDFIRKLLQPNPELRMVNADKIKAHSFLGAMKWKSLAERKVKPPWKPPLKSGEDASYFDGGTKTYRNVDDKEACDKIFAMW